MEQEARVIVKQIKQEVKMNESSAKHINVSFSLKFLAFLQIFLASLL